MFFPIPWMIIGLSFPGSAINANRETSACAHTVPSTYKNLQRPSAILMSVPNLSLRRAQLLLPPESLPWPLSSRAKCSQRVLRTPLSTWHISLEWFDSHPTNHTSLYTGFLAFTLSAGASPLLPLNDCWKECCDLECHKVSPAQQYSYPPGIFSIESNRGCVQFLMK